jgi:hypothetical protein
LMKSLTLLRKPVKKLYRATLISTSNFVANC